MQSEIDFVITWVDGNDPVHKAKRKRWQSRVWQGESKDKEQSVSDKRFVQHRELIYCLRSIKHHAPWYRKIWLVTDNQIPEFLDSDKLAEDRIFVVDHTLLFKHHPDALPTFNTRAIVSQLDVIEGLSAQFIYGNDDFMFGSAVSQDFFFNQDKPVIWGDWQPVLPANKTTLFQQGMINAARMVEADPGQFIHISHGFQPMDKDIIGKLKSCFTNEFANNVQHKFRHRSQFLVESLHNHYCYYKLMCPVAGTEPMVHFSFELCREGTEEKVRFLLDLFKTGERKMLCINEYQALVERMAFVEGELDTLCGPALFSEH